MKVKQTFVRECTEFPKCEALGKSTERIESCIVQSTYIRKASLSFSDEIKMACPYNPARKVSFKLIALHVETPDE